MSLLGWTLLRRAYRFSGLKATSEVGYEAPGFAEFNFVILVTVGGIASSMFWMLAPLSHSPQWLDLVDWKVPAFILGAKCAVYLFVWWFFRFIATAKASRARSYDPELARKECKAKEVLEVELDPFYEAALGIWRVIAGEVWGVEESRRHTPSYPKSLKED